MLMYAHIKCVYVFRYCLYVDVCVYVCTYVCMYVCMYAWPPPNIQISRLTVVSREAKKKQHACASSGPRDHYSELFTRMAALKF